MPRQANARWDIGSLDPFPAAVMHNFDTIAPGIKTIGSGSVAPMSDAMLTRYDPYGMTDESTGIITVDRDMVAIISAWGHILRGAAAAFDFGVLIYINGVQMRANGRRTLTGGGINVAGAEFIKFIWPLTAGDEVECRLFQNSGGNRNVSGCKLSVVPAIDFDSGVYLGSGPLQANARKDVLVQELGFNFCRARRTSAYSMADSTIADFIELPLLDAELDFDYGGDMWDAANGQIVLPRIGASGLVLVNAYLEYAANAIGGRGLYFETNGFAGGAVIAPAAGTAKPTRLKIADVLFGQDTGYAYKIGGFQSSGGPLNATGSLSMLILP